MCVGGGVFPQQTSIPYFSYLNQIMVIFFLLLSIIIIKGKNVKKEKKNKTKKQTYSLLLVLVGPFQSLPEIHIDHKLNHQTNKNAFPHLSLFVLFCFLFFFFWGGTVTGLLQFSIHAVDK